MKKNILDGPTVFENPAPQDTEDLYYNITHYQRLMHSGRQEDKERAKESLEQAHVYLDPIEIDALSLLFVYEIDEPIVREILSLSKKNLIEVLSSAKKKLKLRDK